MRGDTLADVPFSRSKDAAPILQKWPTRSPVYVHLQFLSILLTAFCCSQAEWMRPRHPMVRRTEFWCSSEVRFAPPRRLFAILLDFLVWRLPTSPSRISNF